MQVAVPRPYSCFISVQCGEGTQLHFEETVADKAVNSSTIHIDEMRHYLDDTVADKAAIPSNIDSCFAMRCICTLICSSLWPNYLLRLPFP